MVPHSVFRLLPKVVKAIMKNSLVYGLRERKGHGHLIINDPVGMTGLVKSFPRVNYVNSWLHSCSGDGEPGFVLWGDWRLTRPAAHCLTLNPPITLGTGLFGNTGQGFSGRKT